MHYACKMFLFEQPYSLCLFPPIFRGEQGLKKDERERESERESEREEEQCPIHRGHSEKFSCA